MKKTIYIAIILIALTVTRTKIFAQVPSYMSTNGLKAWYPFNSNTNDLSGMGNNLTGSVSYTTDHLGISSGAVNNFTTISPLKCSLPNFRFGYDSSFTASVWVKYNGATGGGLILKHWITTAPSTDFVWFLSGSSGSEPGFATSISTIWTGTSLTYSMPNGVWIHLVAVYSVGSMKFYMNSQLVATQTLPFSLSTTDQLPLWVGYDPWNNTVMANTDIDDIGIWNRNLASCEIAKIYFATTSLITNHVANDTVVSGTTAHFTITDTGGTATYQWQQNTGSGFTNLSNGGVYLGVNTKTLSINPAPSTMNNYQFRCIRNGNPCSDTSNSAKLVIKTTGIDGLNSDDHFSLSPNPASSNINISSSAIIRDISISNMTGQVVFSGKFDDRKAKINVGDLPGGVYILKVNQNIYYRFIKQ